MNDRRRLTDQEITSALRDLPGWSLDHGRLHRELQFPDFVRAFSFLSGVALLAERMNHHPEWSNVYGKVMLDLMTHDVGGISPLDLELARRVNGLLP